jgi:membrane protease subunit (stomatin/prohibitin family)
VAIIDRIKWDDADATKIAWKFPSDELSTWTQLIVNESQEAYLVHEGVYEGPFCAGRHTLSTENIPLLRGLIGLPFGGRSPFSAEVWFVNKTFNLDIKWGTPDPIQLQDPVYQTMIPIRSFGQYGIRIIDSKKFLIKLVGSVTNFDANTLSEYFRGIFITKIKTQIANTIITNGISVLQISTHLEVLSKMLHEALDDEIEAFGVSLVQFNIHSINVPEDDPAVILLKAALAKRAEMGILGYDYQKERSFDVMEAAAGNTGVASGLIGAGLGLGVGAAMSGPINNAFASIMPNLQPEEKITKTPVDEKIKILKELAELRTSGILTEEEFASEKRKLLEN